MKGFYYFFFVVLCLSLDSCDYAQLITVDLINQTSMPVEVSYSKVRMYKSNCDSVFYDTICHKVDPGMILKKEFLVWWGGRKTLIKDIPFFMFETPTNSVLFVGPEKVKKIFCHKGDDKDSYMFFITDSLFVSKE